MHAADLEPVPSTERYQSSWDLFLIFAGANIVATTLQTGATLAGAVDLASSLAIVLVGCVVASAFVAILVPVGPRLGVPSIVAIRDALGLRGAALVAVLLYVTNFAWFAINNVISASVIVRTLGVPGSSRLWAVILGVVATFIAARGPAAVRNADRIAVPVMLLVGCGLTWALVHQPPPVSVPPAPPLPPLRAFDLVAAYQMSWLLMFADYSRYTKSEFRSAVAVYAALTTTSIWFMVLGLLAARVAGSLDPGLMLDASGLGAWGGLLLALATLTTNFVNVYVSTLAWKSLVPTTHDQVAVWSIGVIGTLISVFSTTWLERYADFMLWLGSLLVPVGGVLIAHYALLKRRPRVADLYEPDGPLSATGGFRLAGVGAWALGALIYLAGTPLGSTLPSVATAIVFYVVLDRWTHRRAPRATPGTPRVS